MPLKPRNFDNYKTEREQCSKLVRKFYHEQGETVRVKKLRNLGVRCKDGRIYDVERIKSGIKLVRFCDVIKNGQVFLCGFDVVLGARFAGDVLTELVEFDKPNRFDHSTRHFKVTKFWQR
jgi:hypothetical protein